MKATVYWIPGPWPGRLGIVPRPRGGDWLKDEIKAWRTAGIDVAVSALTAQEISEFALTQAETQARDLGVLYLSFPIADRQAPVSLPATKQLVQRLESFLIAAKNVAVHCRQGIGSSSLLAACTLIASGISAEDALRDIEQSRGCPVPETQAQREWVKRFAKDVLAASKN